MFDIVVIREGDELVFGGGIGRLVRLLSGFLFLMFLVEVVFLWIMVFGEIFFYFCVYFIV